MDKRAVSQVLVDVLSALAIVLLIGLFLAAINLKNERLKAEITSNIKEKGLSSVLLTYLDMPAEYNGRSMKNAELIIILAENDNLDELSMLYFEDYSARTGFCVEELAIYKGPKKIKTKNPRTCQRQAETVFENPILLDRAAVVIPDKSGSLYQVEAIGYWVEE